MLIRQRAVLHQWIFVTSTRINSATATHIYTAHTHTYKHIVSHPPTQTPTQSLLLYLCCTSHLSISALQQGVQKHTQIALTLLFNLHAKTPDFFLLHQSFPCEYSNTTKLKGQSWDKWLTTTDGVRVLPRLVVMTDILAMSNQHMSAQKREHAAYVQMFDQSRI